MSGLIEPEMHTYLAGAGTRADDFYLRTAPQKASTPYGVIYKTAPGLSYTHDGESYSATNMICSCYGASYRSAKMLASEVITAMEAWLDVQAVFLVGETDLFENKTHHVMLDFLVWHDFG